MDLSVHEGKIPITCVHVAGGGGHAQRQRQSQIHPSYSIIHHDSLAAPTPLSVATPLNSKKGAVFVKYRECLKNHAASIGGNATDGCGEFMPSGKEGTLEALRCSACNCHRNFHRKEIEGRKEKIAQKGVINPFLYNPRPSTQQIVRPLGAKLTSECGEMETYGGAMTSLSLVKKRPRTKFTPKQKEMMLDFAEKVGWRLQRQEESVVQRFCQEIGVKRRVFKVWMHNNKHNLANKSSILQLDRSTSSLNDL